MWHFFPDPETMAPRAWSQMESLRLVEKRNVYILYNVCHSWHSCNKQVGTELKVLSVVLTVLSSLWGSAIPFLNNCQPVFFYALCIEWQITNLSFWEWDCIKMSLSVLFPVLILINIFSSLWLQSNWDEIVDSFDDMNLRETLLRGIYAYGFEKPSAIQQRAILPCIKGERLWRSWRL